jgi:hypothetical protein
VFVINRVWKPILAELITSFLRVRTIRFSPDALSKLSYSARRCVCLQADINSKVASASAIKYPVSGV